jgi:hypothetical protein
MYKYRPVRGRIGLPQSESSPFKLVCLCARGKCPFKKCNLTDVQAHTRGWSEKVTILTLGALLRVLTVCSQYGCKVLMTRNERKRSSGEVLISHPLALRLFEEFVEGDPPIFFVSFGDGDRLLVELASETTTPGVKCLRITVPRVSPHVVGSAPPMDVELPSGTKW